jgi:hypothetical protein
MLMSLTQLAQHQSPGHQSVKMLLVTFPKFWAKIGGKKPPPEIEK